MDYLVTGRRRDDGWPFAGEVMARSGQDAAAMVRGWGIEPEFVQDLGSGTVEYRIGDDDGSGDGGGGGDVGRGDGPGSRDPSATALGGRGDDGATGSSAARAGVVGAPAGSSRHAGRLMPSWMPSTSA